MVEGRSPLKGGLMIHREPEGFKCPRCTKDTSKKHCKSSYCKWFICYKCSTDKDIIVIESSEKYMVLNA